MDVAGAVGLTFTHDNGSTGALADAEIFAPGVALFDFDNDGDLDAYLVQSGPLPSARVASGARPEGRGDRLFRNDLVVGPNGSRTLRFTDVTAESRIAVASYGMGVATGDIDNDGWTDIYLTRLGRNVLLHNNRDGTFSDVSRRSDTDDPAWSVSAAFVDIDHDGWLDLYVGNYLAWRPDADEACSTVTGQPDYCPPAAYRPVADRLFHNERDGTFRDISLRSGVGREAAAALGVTTADFDGDGWLDIYVANDSSENFLWRNQRDGTFTNVALLAGVALDGVGDAEASMGVDAGDFDNDGDEDLVIANITSEGHTLYVNSGGGGFEDWGARSGLRPLSLAHTGFGAAWFDADNDGWLDVLTTSGAVRLLDAFLPAASTIALGQRPQLFRNLANGRFEEGSRQAGTVFGHVSTGRGAAFGDVDNDGDVDVVIGNNGGAAQLLLNQHGQRHHWIGIRAVGAGSRRDMLGAQVTVTTAAGSVRRRRIRADGSYASANDPRVVVGLGAEAGALTVQIAWPGGLVEQWPNVPADRWSTLVQGSGRGTPR